MSEQETSLATVLNKIKMDTTKSLISFCGYVLIISRAEHLEIPEQVKSKISNGTLGLHIGFDMLPDLVLDEEGFRSSGFLFGTSTINISIPWSEVEAIAVPVGMPPSAHIPVATFASYDTQAVAPTPPKAKPSHLKLV